MIRAADELPRTNHGCRAIHALTRRTRESRRYSPAFAEVRLRRPFAKYFAVEYAHVYGQTFGALLVEIAAISEDDSVSYMMLDPDPWEATSFGLISFVPATLPTRYCEAMNPTKGGSRILAGANAGAFWGSSLKWGVFADRISWELAVIATDQDVDISRILGRPCLNAEQVRSYMTSQYHTKDPSDSIATNFSREFLANYSI